MEKGKRIYLKPQMDVMNIQTEGVIAASSGGGTVSKDKFCANGNFSQSKCSHYEHNNNCNNMYAGVKYSVYYKPEGCDVHFWASKYTETGAGKPLDVSEITYEICKGY